MTPHSPRLALATSAGAADAPLRDSSRTSTRTSSRSTRCSPTSTRAAIEERYCLGDLVGYGPEPVGVIERIRSLGIPTIQGNYDEGIGNRRGECGCYYAHRPGAKRRSGVVRVHRGRRGRRRRGVARRAPGRDPARSRRRPRPARPRLAAQDQRVPAARPHRQAARPARASRPTQTSCVSVTSTSRTTGRCLPRTADASTTSAAARWASRRTAIRARAGSRSSSARATRSRPRRQTMPGPAGPVGTEWTKSAGRHRRSPRGHDSCAAVEIRRSESQSLVPSLRTGIAGAARRGARERASRALGAASRSRMTRSGNSRGRPRALRRG